MNITNSYSNYRYPLHKIEEFFASDNGLEGEHSFVESICRPLIGLQNYKPFSSIVRYIPR